MKQDSLQREIKLLLRAFKRSKGLKRKGIIDFSRWSDWKYIFEQRVKRIEELLNIQ